MEVITVRDLKVSVVRKQVKNVNLKVKPYGEVCVSAPRGVPTESIAVFVESKYAWIKKHIDTQKTPVDYAFVSGGEIALFGKRYPFLQRTGKKSGLLLGDIVILTVKNGADAEKTLEKFLKELLLKEVNLILSERVRRTGLVPSSVAIRNMKTRWGTCNVRTKKITLSLQLVKKPLECLDYVITHELGHIINRYHDKRFYNYMDNNYPAWKEVKKLLNANCL